MHVSYYGFFLSTPVTCIFHDKRALMSRFDCCLFKRKSTNRFPKYFYLCLPFLHYGEHIVFHIGNICYQYFILVTKERFLTDMYMTINIKKETIFINRHD